MADGEPLDYIASDFTIETCKGEKRLFTKLSTWELLNLTRYWIFLTDSTRNTVFLLHSSSIS